MSDVKRYDLHFDWNGSTMDEHEDGDWIKSEDYEELEAENKRLKGELKAVVTLGRQVANECSNMGYMLNSSPALVGVWDELIGRLAIQDKERE